MEPKDNSYVLIIDLVGIKKDLALQLSQAIKEGLDEVQKAGRVQGFCVTTAHVKDFK